MQRGNGKKIEETKPQFDVTNPVFHVTKSFWGGQNLFDVAELAHEAVAVYLVYGVQGIGAVGHWDLG